MGNIALGRYETTQACAFKDCRDEDGFCTHCPSADGKIRCSGNVKVDSICSKVMVGHGELICHLTNGGKINAAFITKEEAEAFINDGILQVVDENNKVCLELFIGPRPDLPTPRGLNSIDDKMFKKDEPEQKPAILIKNNVEK